MIYCLPIIAAIIGWLINSFAIRLLFRKVFPKKQQQLAAQIGAMVGQQLFSFASIKQKLTDPAQIKNIIPLVESHLDSFLRERLPKAMPVLSMFIGDSIVNQIKSHLVAELDTLFPILISQYLDNVEKDMNLEQIVRTKIESISAGQLETAVHQLLPKELSAFKMLGALTGFITGLIALLFHFC
ncbi:DUF445 domain-containing protein [Chitinophaga vietnamensis]|uniref:DUF445 domain-containing protein n=1 Tax=Chitinophaga vietnamensis TaxID=2593957 RepID=UPI0011785862|nr:DUF445 family protein [Chitinophaga vietnamensis]